MEGEGDPRGPESIRRLESGRDSFLLGGAKLVVITMEGDDLRTLAKGGNRQIRDTEFPHGVHRSRPCSSHRWARGLIT